MTLKKTLIAAAVATTMSLPAASAYASAIAAADLTINSFYLYAYDPLTGQSSAPTGINLLTDDRTGNASADYNGIEGTGIGLGNITAPNAVDVGYRCAGPDCGTAAVLYGGTIENNTTTHLTTPTMNFAIGDMNVSGSALGTGGSAGFTRADAMATGPTNTGGANSTILNSVTAVTTFAVETTGWYGMGLLADVYRYAWTSLDSATEHATASATTSFTVTIADLLSGDILFTWTPSQLNGGRASFDGLALPAYSFSGNLVYSPVELSGGSYYTMTVNQASNAQIRDIPEPGSLLLMGAGLLGLGALRRRKTA